VVFLCPEWDEEVSDLSQMDSFGTLKSELRPMLEKALTIAPNLVLVLRPNADINRLAQLFSGILSNNRNSSCSVEL
jgi:hypothetical protein